MAGRRDAGRRRLYAGVAASHRPDGQVSNVHRSKHSRIVRVSRNTRDASPARAIACVKAMVIILSYEVTLSAARPYCLHMKSLQRPMIVESEVLKVYSGQEGGKAVLYVRMAVDSTPRSNLLISLRPFAGRHLNLLNATFKVVFC